MNPQARRWEDHLFGRKKYSEFDLFQWIDIFMHEYGMTLDEFRKMKIPTFWMLVEKMNKRYDEQKKANEKSNKPMPHRMRR